MAIKQLTPLRVLPTVIVNEDAPSARAFLEIYRPFFIAGIISVLTAGCTLGAIALWGVAMQQSYTANSLTPFVLAHANSQLYGWVGFFVMGFALQQHLPRNDKKELFQKLAWFSLISMAVGIGLRFAAEPLVAVDREVWMPIGIFSCLLQLAAVIGFVANTSLTRHSKGSGLDWQSKFVFASLFWWLAVAGVEPVAFALSHQADKFASIQFVAEWFSPLREAQFLGFVANMIFGVALVKMGSCFGAKQADKDAGAWAFLLWNGGVLARVIGCVTFYNSGLAPGADLLYNISSTMLALGAILFVISSRMFEKLDTYLPAQKFVRGAFTWLLIGGALIVLQPLHLARIGEPFSHAFTGGIRHALTVGFISQMILGVGMHVVSKMNDIPDKLQRAMWPTFILLNLGNAARVALEIATDYTPLAFRPMGFTGFVELTGLALWGATLLTVMVKARRGTLVHAR
jgi:hypothetical protein